MPLFPSATGWMPPSPPPTPPAPAFCRRKCVGEEVLEQQFTAMLGQLRFDDEVLDRVREALHASHADERHEHQEAIKRLRPEYDRLQVRIDAMQDSRTRPQRTGAVRTPTRPRKAPPAQFGTFELLLGGW